MKTEKREFGIINVDLEELRKSEEEIKFFSYEEGYRRGKCYAEDTALETLENIKERYEKNLPLPIDSWVKLLGKNQIAELNDDLDIWNNEIIDQNTWARGFVRASLDYLTEISR